MISNFFEMIYNGVFFFPFFIAICLAIVFPLFGNIIIIRKEANIAHAIAHLSLLGVVLSLFFTINLYISVFFTAFLGIICMSLLQKQHTISRDAINEIIAQGSLALSIVLLSVFSLTTISIKVICLEIFY